MNNKKINMDVKRSLILFVLLCQAIFMIAKDVNLNEDRGIVNFGNQTFTLDDSHFLLTPEKSDNPYVFNDVLEVIEAINDHSANKSDGSNITLLVSPSVYWLDDPDDPAVRYPSEKRGSTPYAVEIKCDTLSIIGLSENPEDVVFAVNRGQTQGAIGNYTMLHFKGKSLFTENMTYGNYCNIDLEYPLDPSFNRERRNDAIVQAQLGICEGTDRLFARNCRFLSRLNLCPLVGARRSLYEDCYFECTDDALTGSAVYLDCKFTFFSGKPFYSTASTGAVFLNCDIQIITEGTQYLTKMPGMVALIDTRFTSDHPIELQWTRDASPVRCYQSNVTLNGEQVKIDANRPELGIDITGSRLLNAYKVENKGKILYNTPNLLNGEDGWDPLEALPLLGEVEKESGRQLRSIPVALRLLSSSRKLAPDGDTLCITASPRLWGDYPAPIDTYQKINWIGPDVINIEGQNNSIVATSANHQPTQFEGIIYAETPDGLVGATNLKIDPFLKEAPEFKKSPKLSLNNSEVKLDYTLNPGGEDESYIVWYRSEHPDGSNRIPVRHGRGQKAQTYKLTRGDIGYYISATVTPQLSDSHSGETVPVTFERKITGESSNFSLEKELSLSTSFEEIPIEKGELGKPGFWNFDTYKPADTDAYDWKPDENLSWYYGQATDAATGIGLVQATRGARVSYTPTLTGCSDMLISLIAEPCKGPGQGFGSATGQYMDICIKFDPKTLSGYALRIERTPDYDKAVTFTLVHYQDGKVTPVSESVASNCFRNPCHISLEINKDTFSTTAFTDAPAVKIDNPEVKPSISLSVPVEFPTDDTSFVIQHTGTVGASSTLLRDLNVTWK